MRVLVVPKWFPSPERPLLGSFCREQAVALSGVHDVVVIASEAVRRPPFAIFERREASEDGLRTIRIRYRRPRFRAAAMACQVAGMLVALVSLRRRGWRPDVVHAHVYSAGLPALVLARLSGAPLIITEHYTGFARGLIRGEDLLTARIAFRAAQLVAPVSRSLADHVRAIAPRTRVEVVPNVVDTATFYPPPVRRRAASAKPVRLLNVAALAAKKGHADLLRALALLPADGYVLTIAGDGELREELPGLARELGVAERVTFSGAVPKEAVAELMRAADVFVLSRHVENLPCVLLEAMACGLPSAATAVGGVGELIDTGAGVLCPPADPPALAAAIRDAATRPFKTAALAARAERQYGYEPFQRRWSALYTDLVRAGITRSARQRRTASGR